MCQCLLSDAGIDRSLACHLLHFPSLGLLAVGLYIFIVFTITTVILPVSKVSTVHSFGDSFSTYLLSGNLCWWQIVSFECGLVDCALFVCILMLHEGRLVYLLLVSL